MEAVSLHQEDWIPHCDRKKKPKEQSIIEVTTLTFEQDTWFENRAGQTALEGDKMQWLLDMGVKGVRNVNIDGKPVVMKRDEKSDLTYPGEIKPWLSDSLSLIPKSERSRLGFRIRYGKELTGEDRKNF